MAGDTDANLKLIMEPGNRLMHITINDGNKLKAGMVLDARQLDGTIGALIALRGQMEPSFPPSISTGTDRRTITGTHYDFAVDESSGELVFSLRDAGLGWLSLQFGARLLERMLRIARTAQESRGMPQTKQ
jgi:hypothetical protein